MEEDKQLEFSSLIVRPLAEFKVLDEPLWKEEPRFNPTAHLDMGSITCYYNEENRFVHTSSFMILSKFGHEVWRNLIELSNSSTKDIGEEN